VNVIAFILMLIAAIVFAMGDPFWSRYRRSAIHVGLFFLTVGLIVQFITTTREILFR
jgi:hypothetical protein